jgi:hypothetical protein
MDGSAESWEFAGVAQSICKPHSSSKSVEFEAPDCASSSRGRMKTARSPSGGGVGPCMVDGSTSSKPELGKPGTENFWKVAGWPASILPRSSAMTSRLPPVPTFAPIRYEPPVPPCGHTPYFG